MSGITNLKFGWSQETPYHLGRSQETTPSRVNGIIKEEYLCDYQVNAIDDAKKVLDFVVKLYNDERPHNSIGNLVPNHVHELNLKPEKLWRNYYRKNPIIVNQF